MYVFSCLLRRINFNSTKVFPMTRFNERVRITNTRNKITSFDFRQEVKGDVVLYELKNTSHFKYVNILSLVQCASWTHMGMFLYEKVQSAKSSEESKEKSFWKSILENHKFASILSVISVVFGWAIFSATTLYTVRSIRKLILNKGGRTLTIVTYSFPGLSKVKQIPLSQVSSCLHRTHAKKFLPMKIKNKFFYYLLDTKGEFYNPELFDFTAGVTRNF